MPGRRLRPCRLSMLHPTRYQPGDRGTTIRKTKHAITHARPSLYQLLRRLHDYRHRSVMQLRSELPSSSRSDSPMTWPVTMLPIAMA